MATPLFHTIQPAAQLMPGTLDLHPPGTAATTAFLAATAALLVAFVAVTPYARTQSATGDRVVVFRNGGSAHGSAQPAAWAA